MCNMDPDTLEGDHDSNCPRSSRSSQGSSYSSEEEVEMFHGTSEDFARSIERSGFRPSADGMLGRGVYLSRDFSKAAAFGPVVLRCRVRVGRCATIDRQGHPLQKSWQGSYDSADVPRGCGMTEREETCVKDPSRVRVVGRARG